MKKITQKMVLNVVLNYVQSDKTYEVDDDTTISGADILEKAEAMLVQLEKKNSAERKPSAKQIEKQNTDATLRSAILVEMDADTLYSASDLANLPSANGLNTAKISWLMRDLVSSGKVERVIQKRHTYYKMA